VTQIINRIKKASIQLFRILKKIREYIAAYNIYSRTKHKRHKPYKLIKSPDMPDGPWGICGLELYYKTTRIEETNKQYLIRFDTNNNG
jgi:hypothetical protein